MARWGQHGQGSGLAEAMRRALAEVQESSTRCPGRACSAPLVPALSHPRIDPLSRANLSPSPNHELRIWPRVLQADLPAAQSGREEAKGVQQLPEADSERRTPLHTVLAEGLDRGWGRVEGDLLQPALVLRRHQHLAYLCRDSGGGVERLGLVLPQHGQAAVIKRDQAHLQRALSDAPGPLLDQSESSYILHSTPGV